MIASHGCFVNPIVAKSVHMLYNGAMDIKNFIESAGKVVPSRNQLAWFDTEFYGFVHFTVNTYTGLEWGDGTEPESIFNPVELDCDSWVNAFKSAGMRGMVLTAKHHDGFCLWQSDYTAHSVKSSGWRNGKGDVVKEASEACRRGGLKFGLYLSPWDRNSPLYGSDEYNVYYEKQLTELLTRYGELFMVWFDGACGEGPNGRKQVYAYERWLELIHKYQPNCAVFGEGTDVRWCGNEAGKTRHAEWAVVPGELAPFCPKQTSGAPLAGGISHITPRLSEVGSLPSILYSDGLAFCGAEVDMSIRPGWFYHPEEEPHSLDRLFSTYVRSVGGNACFHLNVPPMPNGRFDPRDIARLSELGKKIRDEFSKPIECRCTEKCVSDTQSEFELEFSNPEKIRWIVLKEDIAQGQRVEHFIIESNGSVVYEGTTIGHKRICQVDTQSEKLRIRIVASRGKPILLPVEVFA